MRNPNIRSRKVTSRLRDTKIARKARNSLESARQHEHAHEQRRLANDTHNLTVEHRNTTRLNTNRHDTNDELDLYLGRRRRQRDLRA